MVAELSSEIGFMNSVSGTCGLRRIALQADGPNF